MRALHFLLVGWLLMCVGLIVPAHNGAHAHALPDEAHPHAGHGHVHTHLGHDHGHHHGEQSGEHSGERPGDASHEPGTAEDCSICQFAAGLTQPQPVDVRVMPPQRVGTVATAEPVSPASRQVILPFDGRAPPAAA